jgi:hypothetical protein
MQIYLIKAILSYRIWFKLHKILLYDILKLWQRKRGYVLVKNDIFTVKLSQSH